MLIFLLSLSLLIWIVFLIDALIGFRSLDRLEDEVPLGEGPLLSVVVAARNEEAHIKKSVLSQLNQTYRNVEWLLVNDRSTDQTGKVMEELKLMDDRVQVIHIEELPEGWLGKNHALYQGYLASKGDRILFTDADVESNKYAFAKALGYFERNGLDHLTAAPNMRADGFWLKSFVAFFLFGFSYYKRPWAANNPKSKIGIGIGAFNLVSKAGYESFGTHEAIKMRPDDDLQLGLKMKQAGLKQRIASALTLIEVEWYGTLREALAGLEKNTFAGLHYRLSMVVFAVFGTFVSQVLPFFTLFIPDRTIVLLSLGNIIGIAVLYMLVLRKMTRFSPVLFAAFPLTASIFIYSIIRASYLTLKRGGIIWRGTKYSLKELRKP
ncbi:glycosyltransferase [Neobacillus notoginsengisoli]|uniref:Glycosyltransferase n=1 Tax=Neobacillus notoginsengisoli TaxID=1578198 RepID=A0A417YV32_9BACI|nr:glycosyltransferase family 2 protein [Neobacillus notoginsengisoli]RHW41154.1 glycosyltransferase [Neobacillus notoginsengisoli]